MLGGCCPAAADNAAHVFLVPPHRFRATRVNARPTLVSPARRAQCIVIRCHSRWISERSPVIFGLFAEIVCDEFAQNLHLYMSDVPTIAPHQHMLHTRTSCNPRRGTVAHAWCARAHRAIIASRCVLNSFGVHACVRADHARRDVSCRVRVQSCEHLVAQWCRTRAPHQYTCVTVCQHVPPPRHHRFPILA